MSGFQPNSLDSFSIAIQQASSQYYQLIVIIDPLVRLASQTLTQLAERLGCGYLNLGVELGRKLVDLTPKQRSLRLTDLLDDLISATNADCVVLNRLDILFDTDLHHEPLATLQRLSRNTTIIAYWPGNLEGQTLVYSEIGRKDYRCYPTASLIVRKMPNWF